MHDGHVQEVMPEVLSFGGGVPNLWVCPMKSKGCFPLLAFQKLDANKTTDDIMCMAEATLTELYTRTCFLCQAVTIKGSTRLEQTLKVLRAIAMCKSNCAEIVVL